jgi:hypothetical protein
LISAIGYPCEMRKAWHGCEPAMTIIPDFGITGTLTIIMSLVAIIWAIGFIHRKNGGPIFLLLSIVLLLFGGGFIPPLYGFITGFAAKRIKPKPADWFVSPGGKTHNILALFWPGSLIVFLLWGVIEWILGYYFNDMLIVMVLPAFLVQVGLLTLFLSSAFAHERAN